jgi:hypothetical protein
MPNQNLGSEERVPLRDRPLPEIAGTLQQILGQRLTAFAIAETDPRRIGAFVRGEADPSEMDSHL